MSHWDRAVALIAEPEIANSPAPPYALAPDAQAAAARLIRALSLTRVVECGPGDSTFVLAPLVSGAYHSLEHDPVYVERVASRLRDTDLTSRVALHHCRIVARRIGAFAGRTYDTRALAGRFDFALIDGPPSRTVGRLLTLPALWPHLDVGTLVLLDDARRARYERRALAAWAGRYGDAVRIQSFDRYAKGLALIEKRAEAPAGRRWPAIEASLYETALTWQSRLRDRIRGVSSA
jgi:predicted O-methyltransferase YrrM